MTIIVENGNGFSNSQSYVSLTDVQAYATLYGLDATGLSEAAVLRAMQYMEGEYRGRWTGCKQSDVQALSWPRSFGVYNDGYAVPSSFIPHAVKDATCALSVRAITNTTLAPDVSRQNYVTAEKIGPIEVKYSDRSGLPTSTVFSDIEVILNNLLAPMGFGKVVRT